MTETYITHPGMITVDGGITWYTPDELVTARETDILVDALTMRENDWTIYNTIPLEELRAIAAEIPGLNRIERIAEYVRRTGREVFMRVRT